jgi:hypothetical protein
MVELEVFESGLLLTAIAGFHSASLQVQNLCAALLRALTVQALCRQSHCWIDSERRCFWHQFCGINRADDLLVGSPALIDKA